MKNKVSAPRRERLLVQQALRKMGLRFWENIQFWNPLYTGLRRKVDGGRQWLDFVIRTPYGILVLIFKVQYATTMGHDFEKRALLEKQAFLRSKNIPYLMLSRTLSQGLYEVMIEFWMRKIKRREFVARAELHRPRPEQPQESHPNSNPPVVQHDEPPSTS
jgi:hypothetical protein